MWCKYCVHIFVNRKMILVETTSGMRGKRDRGE
jgi:hypothetical protein